MPEFIERKKKRELNAEDFPDTIYAPRDSSFFEPRKPGEYTRQGQIANRRAKGEDQNTGRPKALVHSQDKFNKSAIDTASKPIPANSNLTTGDFTEEDEKSGKIIQDYEETVKSIYDRLKGRHRMDGPDSGKWEREVGKANDTFDKRMKKSRGFKE